MTIDRRVERAISSILSVLQGTGFIPLGQDLRPVAERVYQRAGRDVMKAFQAEMREADQW